MRRVSAPALEELALERVARLCASGGDWGSVRSILRRVELGSDAVHLTVQLNEPAPLSLLKSRIPAADELVENEGELRLMAAVRPVFRGGRTWLVAPNGAAAVVRHRPDPTLVKGLRTAHRMLEEVDAGPTTPPDRLLRARGVGDSYLRSLAPLAFLAPDIQQAIFEGRLPAGLTLQQLLRRPIPLAWADQRTEFGFPAAA